MTLADISAIAQAVAAVAVLISLAAVYGQVRQTNKIARAELTHSVWLSGGEMNLSLYDTPEKAELMHRALYRTAPLSDSERLRMMAGVIPVALGLHEAGFTLRQRGLIETSAYNSMEAAARLYMGSAIVQEWWAGRRVEGKDAAYVALLDGFLARIKQGQPPPSTL